MTIHPRHAVQRLTALWAFSEAGLGGLLHAYSLPFTALSVGGIAVILITLMASYSTQPARDILRSTLVVLILKAAISPHSPVMAYAAVGFQGLLGALVFGLLRHTSIAAILLGVLAMLESSLQKLFTLTVIYGLSLWEAIDGLFHYAGRQLGVDTAGLSLSMGLISGYVGLYLIGGLFIGWLAGRMVLTQRLQGDKQLAVALLPNLAVPTQVVIRRAWYKKPWVRYIVVLILLAVAMVFLQQGEGVWQEGAYVIIRSLLIVSIWVLLLGPLLKKGLDRLLRGQRSRYAQEVDDTLAIIPVLRQVAGPAWQAQKGTGWKRVWYFLVVMIHFTLTYDPAEVQKKAPQ